MCGIAGYISTRKLDQSAMLNSLRHRGPDDAGAYSEQTGDRELFLGHTRLSILDLSVNGHQPMWSLDGQLAIVFNGEVYNFKDLRKQFLSAEQFTSQTDTEVVLKLYQKLGITFLKELNGDFAMAIYDKSRSKLFLIRDRAGVKPLYYYHHNNSLIFASEIKSILAAGIKPELNSDQLQNYFVFKYSPGNTTLFKNISRLAPASYMEVDLLSLKCTINSYWDLHTKEEYSRLSYKDASQVLFELIQDSVKMRLISDVPVGNFLSGGLDSSIIASFIKDRQDIIHYCARKNAGDLQKEGTTDDFKYAKSLADQWHLHLLPAPIGSDEANIEHIRKTVFYCDDLIADGSQIPAYLITKSAAERSKVILSGMGADELFMGYAGHMLSMLSNRLDQLPSFMASPLASMAAGLDQGKGKFLAYRRYLHKIGKYYHYPHYKHGLFQLVGDFENSASVFKGNKQDTIDHISSYYKPGRDVFESTMQFELENFLVKNLHYTDRMSMANSVECRVPFLDHRIMELAYNLPREFKLSNSGNSKRILKDAFKKTLPKEIINRRKAGFGMPLRSILSDTSKIDTLMDKELLHSMEGFSWPDIERVIESHIKGIEDNSSIIYALISFCEWYKVNIH